MTRPPFRPFRTDTHKPVRNDETDVAKLHAEIKRLRKRNGEHALKIREHKSRTRALDADKERLEIYIRELRSEIETLKGQLGRRRN